MGLVHVSNDSKTHWSTYGWPLRTGYAPTKYPLDQGPLNPELLRAEVVKADSTDWMGGFAWGVISGFIIMPLVLPLLGFYVKKKTGEK